MKLFKYLPLFLLAVAAEALPTPTEVSINSTSEGTDNLVISRSFFLESNVKYAGQHEIVNIIVPLNKINFEDEDDENNNTEVTVFFVEADVNDKGERTDKGLYVLKNGTATKILDNGRDATAFNDESKKVYLGASDGIYVYEDENGKTNKYGSITDNIIQIGADNKTGVIYYLTNDHKVFFVTDGGSKKKLLNFQGGVKEFVIDYNSNMYLYDDKKELYICNLNQGAFQKVEGIPSHNEIKLVRPMFAQEDGVFVVIDDRLYLLNADKTVDKSKVTFEVKPTAYAPEATLIQYYAFEKKIYEFNVLSLIVSELEELKDFLNDKRNEIQNIASKSRSSFGA